MSLGMENQSRSKKFMSIDSLCYEEERLNTFIDWPVKFISPGDLASNGFYYLRSKDHCACAFCRGIIGAWEEGDSPIGEHRRHFPECPLINGYPTPNVPMLHGQILAKLNKGGMEHCTQVEENLKKLQPVVDCGEDVCGTGKTKILEGVNLQAGQLSPDVPLSMLGLQMYSGPKRKDYLTYECRLNTFKRWPEKVQITPEMMAEAGFFYIGLSDHVRCFHCGNGLRNWEQGDGPWQEHARWYPNCHFVLLKKGIEFVDEVRRTKPPYLHTPPNQPSTFLSKGAKYNKFELSDEEMDRLMDLEVIKAVSEMGFPLAALRVALRKKLEQTGVPFLALDPCIEGVLQALEDNKNNAEFQESLTAQEKKLAASSSNTPYSQVVSTAEVTYSSDESEESFPGRIFPQVEMPYESEVQQANTPALMSTNETVNPQLNPTSLPNETDVSALQHESASLPPLPQHNLNNHTLTELPPLPNDNEPLRASTPTNDVDIATAPDIEGNVMIVEPMISSSTLIASNASVNSRANMDPLVEADEIMETAAKALANDSLSSSGNGSFESLNQDLEESECGQESRRKMYSKDQLAKELEILKENRTCRVCMDTEMEVVFLPCTHMVTCASCAVALTSCPICRREIQYALKPIFS